jgi:hypothetical protein
MPNICPAIARGLTNYQTTCELNASLQSRFAVRSESDYRARLQGDPRPFAQAIKDNANFQPYWPVTPCTFGKDITESAAFYTPYPAK